MVKPVNATLAILAEANGNREPATASGNPAVFDGDGTLLKGLKVELDAGEGAGYTGVVVIAAGKNLAERTDSYTAGSSRTSNGITCTVMDDLSLQIAGTYVTGSGNYTNFYPVYGNLALPPGKYVLSGCPSGGGTSVYDVRLQTGGTTTSYPLVASDSGNRATFTLNDYTPNLYVTVRLRNSWLAEKGTINLHFPIMIRRYDDNDDYAMPNVTKVSYTFPDPPGIVTAGVVDVLRGVLTVGGVDYPLTPKSIVSLLGGNIIYASAGTVKVGYAATGNKGTVATLIRHRPEVIAFLPRSC